MWTRDSTKEWIAQIELRLEDIEWHIHRTTEWCDNNGVYSERLIFTCLYMTIVWVAHMRDETITKHEIFEILGVKDYHNVDDAVFELGLRYQHMDHVDMLEDIAADHLY